MKEIIKKDSETSYHVVGYEEMDQQEHESIEENNKLIFRPEFIPYYLKEVQKYGFSNTEGLVYGFVRFYLKNNPRGQFYFTNEQLAYMLDVSISTISNSINKICECGEFKVTYKVKANGGTFRLLESSESDYEKVKSQTLKKLRPNNNKINNNKINNIIIQKEASFKILEEQETRRELSEKLGIDIRVVNKECDSMIDWIKSKGKRYKDYKAFARNWLRRIPAWKANENYNQNAKQFEDKWQKIKGDEKRIHEDWEVDDGEGGFVKLSDMLKNDKRILPMANDGKRILPINKL